MKKDWIIIIVLSVIIVLMVTFKKPIQKVLSRGYRNKNPGNIILNGENWKGEIEGEDQSFKTFESMSYGYRGIFVVLNSYFNKRKLKNIEQIIRTYAPSNENDTESYIKTVEKKTGLDRTDDLDFYNKNQMKNLVAAISFVENGIAPDLKEIDKGYELYFS